MSVLFLCFFLLSNSHDLRIPDHSFGTHSLGTAAELVADNENKTAKNNNNNNKLYARILQRLKCCVMCDLKYPTLKYKIGTQKRKMEN